MESVYRMMTNKAKYMLVCIASLNLLSIVCSLQRRYNRYWIGILLIVRGVLLLILTLNTSGNYNVNPLTITSVIYALLARPYGMHVA